MSVNILTLWCRLVVVTQRAKILASSFMAYITFNTIFLLDVRLVEKVHQFLGGYFIPERKKVNLDFI